MKNAKLIFSFLFLLLSTIADGQLTLDHALQLSGSGFNAEITGLKIVAHNQDAVSVDYIQRDSLKFALSTGSSNAYAVALSPSVSGGYTQGMLVYFISNFTNTGAATLSVNGLGAKTIKKNYNVDLAANDIQGGQSVIVMFDGVNFQMLSQLGSSCGSAPVATGSISGAMLVCQQQYDVVYAITNMAGAATYNWTYSGTGVSIVGNGVSAVLYFSASATSGTLSVTGINACGESSSALTASITVNTTPSSAFTANNPSPTVGSIDTFLATTSGVTYNWAFPGASITTSLAQNNYSISWPQSGTYNVALTSTGSNGCASTSYSTVTVSCHGTASFAYTGMMQTWSAPSCVSSVSIDAAGAQGGSQSTGGGTSGKGGRVQIASLPVTGGTSYEVYVGGSNGYNGGGASHSQNGSTSSCGGGATDIRISSLSDRIMVAGGGGGSNSSGSGGTGGLGGGTIGGAGQSSGTPAGGGTGSLGGVGEIFFDNGGCSCNTNGVQGSSGNGGSLGAGGVGYGPPFGGGGGGGYFGGGSGSEHGGGGGSSYVTTGATGVTHTQGYQAGNGYLTITW